MAIVMCFSVNFCWTCFFFFFFAKYLRWFLDRPPGRVKLTWKVAIGDQSCSRILTLIYMHSAFDENESLDLISAPTKLHSKIHSFVYIVKYGLICFYLSLLIIELPSILSSFVIDNVIKMSNLGICCDI